MRAARALLEAQHELIDTALRYKEEDLELARDFGAKYREQLLRACAMPGSGHLIAGLPQEIDFEIRRFLFRRFKHVLYVAVLPAEVVVLAVAHQHQKPFYWMKRLAKVKPTQR